MAPFGSGHTAFSWQQGSAAWWTPRRSQGRSSRDRNAGLPPETADSCHTAFSPLGNDARLSDGSQHARIRTLATRPARSPPTSMAPQRRHLERLGVRRRTHQHRSLHRPPTRPERSHRRSQPPSPRTIPQPVAQQITNIEPVRSAAREPLGFWGHAWATAFGIVLSIPILMASAAVALVVLSDNGPGHDDPASDHDPRSGHHHDPSHDHHIRSPARLLHRLQTTWTAADAEMDALGELLSHGIDVSTWPAADVDRLFALRWTAEPPPLSGYGRKPTSPPQSPAFKQPAPASDLHTLSRLQYCTATHERRQRSVRWRTRPA